MLGFKLIHVSKSGPRSILSHAMGPIVAGEVHKESMGLEIGLFELKSGTTLRSEQK